MKCLYTEKRLCLLILCMPIHVVWFFFLLLLWCHICISLHWCCWRRMLWIFCTFVNWKRFCLIISTGQTLFWNRLLIPGDSRTHTYICQRYWVKCFESQLRLCHLIWLFLNGFHQWRENTTRMHHLCRYTSFVERPDSRERAKHHSMSEISDLLSAIKGMVHRKNDKICHYLLIFMMFSLSGSKMIVKLVHITCALYFKSSKVKQ